MTLLDCRDYMAFLQHVPVQWISRARANPGAPGWAPFRGPLSARSVRQAITIVVSMFHWLQATGYIGKNPWLLVNQKIGDDKEERVLQSKALSEVATQQVIAYCKTKLPAPAAHRMVFIVQFIAPVWVCAAPNCWQSNCLTFNTKRKAGSCKCMAKAPRPHRGHTPVCLAGPQHLLASARPRRYHVRGPCSTGAGQFARSPAGRGLPGTVRARQILVIQSH